MTRLETLFQSVLEKNAEVRELEELLNRTKDRHLHMEIMAASKELAKAYLALQKELR